MVFTKFFYNFFYDYLQRVKVEVIVVRFRIIFNDFRFMFMVEFMVLIEFIK